MDKQVILKSLENTIRTAVDEGIGNFEIMNAVIETLPESDRTIVLSTRERSMMNGTTAEIFGVICNLIDGFAIKVGEPFQKTISNAFAALTACELERNINE